MMSWEDFQVGDRQEMGRHTFTADEIMAFGRQYDPQPFHIDAQAAKQSLFGGLVASGWHTVLASRLSTSRKGVGLVKQRWEAVNERGELVLSMEGWNMFGRRP